MDEINVLWTGGWDSTYRILELLFIENHPVRPYYIVDPNRKSLAYEIIAMTRIRTHLQITSPAQSNKLLPTEMVLTEAIPPDTEISGRFYRLESKVRIGSQYDWLARFAKSTGKELELCVEKNAVTYSELFREIIAPLLRGQGHFCRIEGPFLDPDAQLFTYFRFPVIHLSKEDMRIISEKQGFFDIMRLTWFCLTPRKGFPCGECRPCSIAPQSGLEYPFYPAKTGEKIIRVCKRFFL